LLHFKVYYHNQADPPLGTVLVLFRRLGAAESLLTYLTCVCVAHLVQRR